jgi:hypothetical protein
MKQCFILTFVLSLLISSIQASPVVEIETKIIKIALCSEDSVKTSTQITIMNKGQMPMLFHRNYFAVSQSAVSKNVELFNKGEYLVHHVNFLSARSIDIKKFTPSNPIFVKLGVGESFTAVSSDYFDLNIQNSTNHKGLTPGTYVLSQVIYTWGLGLWPGSELREKWGKMGYLLWTDPILTKPMEFTISNNLTQENCD